MLLMHVMMFMLLSFTITIITMISRQYHFLPSLLCLEALMLYMLCFIPTMMNNMMLMNMSSYMIIMLIMSVSSASMGLSLLVLSSRKDGSDNSQSLNLSKC